ncbi:MAG: hypothetical protein NTW87_14085 [Planctomycetota bacterium]|nr:hypothetical protein [Planctomycetota bacterium]
MFILPTTPIKQRKPGSGNPFPKSAQTAAERQAKLHAYMERWRKASPDEKRKMAEERFQALGQAMHDGLSWEQEQEDQKAGVLPSSVLKPLRED